MWRKIKEWLIKKLGGYTKSEYQIAAYPLRRNVVNMDRRDIVTLRAETAVDYEELANRGEVYDEHIRERLHRELAAQLPPFVEYRGTTRLENCTGIICATLRVVRREW